MPADADQAVEPSLPFMSDYNSSLQLLARRVRPQFFMLHDTLHSLSAIMHGC